MKKEVKWFLLHTIICFVLHITTGFDSQLPPNQNTIAMADFSIYAPKLRQFEGGFVNDPRDSGGATYGGITLARFRQEFGMDKTVTDLKNMTDDQWCQIMKKGYWDWCGADDIKNQAVAEIFVDWCVNSGLGMIKKVQGIVGTKADGVVGPKTIAAINARDARQLHYAIKAARADYYAQCVKSKSSNIAFYDGWMNRLCQFKYSSFTTFKYR